MCIGLVSLLNKIMKSTTAKKKKESRYTVQEPLNRAIFSNARLDHCNELRGTVQVHLNLAIFSIARFNLSI